MIWWKSLFRKRALDVQLDSELRFHMEKLMNDNIAAGMAPEEARDTRRAASSTATTSRTQTISARRCLYFLTSKGSGDQI
jgi:hypothetical protein